MGVELIQRKIRQRPSDGITLGVVDHDNGDRASAAQPRAGRGFSAAAHGAHSHAAIVHTAGSSEPGGSDAVHAAGSAAAGQLPRASVLAQRIIAQRDVQRGASAGSRRF